MKTKVYVHSSKEAMFEHGRKLGLSGTALELFKYAAYEVELTLSVDLVTGEATIIEVDGRKVADGEDRHGSEGVG